MNPYLFFHLLYFHCSVLEIYPLPVPLSCSKLAYRKGWGMFGKSQNRVQKICKIPIFSDSNSIQVSQQWYTLKLKYFSQCWDKGCLLPFKPLFLWPSNDSNLFVFLWSRLIALEYVVCVTVEFHMFAYTGDNACVEWCAYTNTKFKIFVQKDKSINIAWFKTGRLLAHSQTCLWEYPLGWCWCSWNREQTLSNYCQSEKALGIILPPLKLFSLTWNSPFSKILFKLFSSSKVSISVVIWSQWFDLICAS